jgi:hypothetical protein
MGLDFIEDIKKYLPVYLSSSAEGALFSELKSFPKNIDDRLYTSYLKDEKVLYQGDGLKDMLVINLPDNNIRRVPSIVISNTCDSDPNNRRLFESRICYCPIFNLEKYKQKLLDKEIENSYTIDKHLQSIKSQQITQIFYLPTTEDLDDSIIFFDRVNNCQNKDVDRETISTRRLFTLSDYGFYL